MPPMSGPRRALRAALVSLGSAFSAGCAGIGNVPGGTPLAVPAIREAPPVAVQNAHYLYAAQGFYSSSAVYRYRLHADGLPSKKPDGVLKLNFPFPGSIAVGPNGDLYVSSSGGGSGCGQTLCFVAVFAPGALGNAKPIRVLYVPQTPVFLAVDQRGYLDVSTHPGWRRPVANVYRPGAQGNDSPIHEIAVPGLNALGARRGIVYIQTNAIGVGVEAVPEHPFNRPPVFYTYGYNYSSNGVATDATHLYAQFFWPAGSAYDLATAVYYIDQPGPPIRTIVATGCTVSRNGGALGYGLAIYKKYLFEGCLNAPGGDGAVQVYDSTKSGPQKPIIAVRGGDTGVAIGP